MSAILGLDPGPGQTGFVVLLDGSVRTSGVLANDGILQLLPEYAEARYTLAIEMIASYGMPVGREVFETVWWTGRFTQAWRRPEQVVRIFRADVKTHLCKSSRAKDGNVRQALIDLLGPQGTKRAPGPTYGVKSHAWAALGVAVCAAAAAAPITVAGMCRKQDDGVLIPGSIVIGPARRIA